VAGNAALLVDPRSQGELRAALIRMLESADLRRALALAGRERAREFRWDVCARKSLEFFRHVTGE
jgi:glycosyltransferase involved in cell wall biosynthesis